MVSNWAGNVSFSAARFRQPSSIPEVQQVVATSGRVRALGTGHSFNRIADTAGDLICLERLPTVVAVDADASQVKVSADVTYGELAPRLHGAGFALANLGSLPHISIAGACATGTHGSGNTLGNLATSVSAIELVTASGDLVTVERGNPDFGGLAVGLGAFGIIVGLTLDVEPTFYVRQHVYDGLPFDQVDRYLDEILASAYSVSLFTDWRGPLIRQVWLKRRLPAAEPEPEAEPELHGAVLADGPRHPVPGMSPTHCTPQLGVPGPWHKRLPHFQFDQTPSAGRELQSEYLLPRSSAVAAVHALDEVRESVAPVLQVSEIRTVAADELWLSPSYQRDTVALHFTWIDDMQTVAPVRDLVEEQLAPFEPRPHWGKLFRRSGQYQRRGDFTELMARYDPAGKFRNDFLDAFVVGEVS